MMDIMKEFADILGISNDELKKIVGDGSIKVSHNGKPIIDIENGVDKLAPKEECKDLCKKSPIQSKEESLCTCKTQSCPCSEPTVTCKEIWLNNDLLMVNPEEFIMIDKVAGYPLADSQTEITFSHKTSDGWVPGITNNQLLTILCERFKKDPKKVTVLKALMDS